MKIVIASIESKLNEQFFSQHKQIAIDSISHYIEAIILLEKTGVSRDLMSGQDNQAEESINALFVVISEGLDNSNPIYQILDALRHTFSCYAYNGLHELYTRQENESWHPTIRLTEILEPNDIDSLSQEFKIYRGCDIRELQDKSYGQSWSTSLSVAREFAFRHYQSQDWFDESRRVVLEATYSREDVLFSDQSGEFEVVVDVNRLHAIQVHG